MKTLLDLCFDKLLIIKISLSNLNKLPIELKKLYFDKERTSLCGNIVTNFIKNENLYHNQFDFYIDTFNKSIINIYMSKFIMYKHYYLNILSNQPNNFRIYLIRYYLNSNS